MEEQKEDIFPIDKEDADLASFTSRLRRRTPNGNNRHKSRPISYPPCFAFDLQKPTFLKGRLMDRKPQKLIDPIPKEIAFKAGRKVKFADEAGMQLVSYLEIPNKFDRLGFRSLTNISSTFEKVIEDNFDDVFESVDDVFDDIFKTSFERPLFSLDVENNEKINSPGQKRKYGLKGQAFPKENFPKESLSFEQKQLSDSTSRKKQLSELSSPHVKLRKYSLEEWIITESDEESNCDITTQTSTTFLKTECKDNISHDFQFHPSYQKSYIKKDQNETSLSSYQDDRYNLPRNKKENDWVNIPVLVYDKEKKENYNPRDVIINSHNISKETIRNSKSSPAMVDDKTELKYQELCRRLCPAGQDKSSLDHAISSTKDTTSKKHLSFTSDESVEEVNVILVIDNFNNKLPDTRAQRNNNVLMDNSIEVSYTYCPNISTDEVPADGKNVMTSSFDENPNIAFTISAPKNTDNSTCSKIVSTAQTEECDTANSSNKSDDNIIPPHKFSVGKEKDDSEDFLKSTESALQDILEIFDSVIFPEENKEAQLLNASKTTSKSLKESHNDERENSLVPNDTIDKNMDTYNNVHVFSANCNDYSDMAISKSDNTTPCIQVLNDSDIGYNQNDVISGIEVIPKSDHKITVADKTKRDKNLLYVCEENDETNDDLVSLYHDSESGYVTYSHQDSLETIRNFDFDDEGSDDSCSYETSSIETDNESRCSHSRTTGITKSNCDNNSTSSHDSESIHKDTYKQQQQPPESNKKSCMFPAEKNNASNTDDSCSDSCTESKRSTTDKILQPNSNIKTWTFDGTETNDFDFNQEASSNRINDSDTSASRNKNNEEESSDESSYNNSSRQNNETFNHDVSYVSSLSSKTNSVESISKCEEMILESFANVDKYSSDSDVMSQTTGHKTLCKRISVETNALINSTPENLSYHCENSIPDNNRLALHLNNIDDENNPFLECSPQIFQPYDDKLNDKKLGYQDGCQQTKNEEICNPFAIGNGNDTQLPFSVSSDDDIESKLTNQNKIPDKHIERSNNSEKIPYIHATVCSNDIENINIKINEERNNSSSEGSNDQHFNKNTTAIKENMTFENKHSQILRTLHGISSGSLTSTSANVKSLPYSSDERHSCLFEKRNSFEISSNDQLRNDPQNVKHSKNRHKHKLIRSNTLSSSDSENSDASVQCKKHKRTKRVKKIRLLSKDKQTLTAANNCANKLQLSESILEEDPGNESDVESNESSTNSLTSSSSSIQEDMCLSQESVSNIQSIPTQAILPVGYSSLILDSTCAANVDTRKTANKSGSTIEDDIIISGKSSIRSTNVTDEEDAFEDTFVSSTVKGSFQSTNVIDEDTVTSNVLEENVITSDLVNSVIEEHAITSENTKIQDEKQNCKSVIYKVSFNTDTSDTTSSNSEFSEGGKTLKDIQSEKENADNGKEYSIERHNDSKQSDINLPNTSQNCTCTSEISYDSVLGIPKEYNLCSYISNDSSNDSNNENTSDKTFERKQLIYENDTISDKLDENGDYNNSNNKSTKINISSDSDRIYELTSGRNKMKKDDYDVRSSKDVQEHIFDGQSLNDLAYSTQTRDESSDYTERDTNDKNYVSDISDNGSTYLPKCDKLAILYNEITHKSDTSGCHKKSDGLNNPNTRSNDETKRYEKLSLDSNICHFSLNNKSDLPIHRDNITNCDSQLSNCCDSDNIDNDDSKEISQNNDKSYNKYSHGKCDLLNHCISKDSAAIGEISHTCYHLNTSCQVGKTCNEFVSHSEHQDSDPSDKCDINSSKCELKFLKCDSQLKCSQCESQLSSYESITALEYDKSGCQNNTSDSGRKDKIHRIKEHNIINQTSDISEGGPCSDSDSVRFVKENKSDSHNREVSDDQETDSNESDSHNHEVSDEQETGSNESDSHNHEVSDKQETGSNESDSHNHEVSDEQETGSNESDSHNHEVSDEQETDSNESDSHNREVSDEQETDSNESDSHNREVSDDSETEKSESDTTNSETDSSHKTTSDSEQTNGDHKSADGYSSNSISKSSGDTSGSSDDENSALSSDNEDFNDKENEDPSQKEQDKLHFNPNPEKCQQIAEKFKTDKRELVKSLSLSNSSGSELEIFGKCGSVNKIDDVNVTVTITCDGQLIVNEDTCGVYRN